MPFNLLSEQWALSCNRSWGLPVSNEISMDLMHAFVDLDLIMKPYLQIIHASFVHEQLICISSLDHDYGQEQ